MLTALIAGVALMASNGQPDHPVALDTKAACRLVLEDGFVGGETYSIRGNYIADGMHGSWFELPGCQQGLAPQLDGAALARSVNFHTAFRDRCGGWLHGDDITGLFTGHFVRRNARLYGMPGPGEVTFFVITDVETSDQDPASIECPGK